MPALLHPRLAQVHRGKIACLLQGFEAEGSRSEAREIIRSRIDAAMTTPGDGGLYAEMTGDLATMLVLVLVPETKKSSKADAFEVRQVKMVAGTGFGRCRTLFRLKSNILILPMVLRISK